MSPVIRQRIAVAVLSLSAAGFASWQASEGFTPVAVIPTKGDVPTIGHGSTQYEDGRRVTLADPPITRQRAAELATNLLDGQYVACVKRSLGEVPMHPVEFEQAVDFAGQYGCGAWRGSSMLARMRAGEYAGACQAYLAYRYMTSAQPLQGYAAYQWGTGGRPTRWRFDCSAPGNKVCRGVWTRQQARHAACIGAQQ